MLILDNKPTPEISRPPIAGPSRPTTSTIHADPPAYTPPVSDTTPLLPHSAPSSRKYKRKALKRFAKAFAFAALASVILILFVSLIGADVYRDRRWYNDHIWGEPAHLQPRAGDGIAINCGTKWQSRRTSTLSQTVFSNFSSSADEQDPPESYKYHAHYKLNSPDLFYIISRGAHASGSIHFVPAVDAAELTAEIEVDLFDKRLKKLFKICQLEQPDGGVGLGVLTPSVRWWWLPIEYQSIPFKITINVPTGSLHSPVHSIKTDVPNFSHSFGRLGIKYFESVALRSKNQPITVENGILGGDIRMETTNASIRGTFLSDQQIHLVTVDSSLHAEIYLDSKIAQERNKSVAVSLLNFDGPINATVALSSSLTIISRYLSSASSPPVPYASTGVKMPESGGTFRITAQTNSAPLTLSVPTLPVGAKLSLNAHTTNEPISVSLNRAYEGYLHLFTTNDHEGSGEIPTSSVHLKPGVRAKDPYKEGREYQLELDNVWRGEIKGHCTWGNSISKFASNLVDVETGGASASLTIT